MNNPLIPSERDWPKDFELENGNYLCRCSTCRETFVGYKRRMTCKLCAKKHEEWWAGLTPEEQREHEAETLRLAHEIFAKELDK